MGKGVHLDAPEWMGGGGGTYLIYRKCTVGGGPANYTG